MRILHSVFLVIIGTFSIGFAQQASTTLTPDKSFDVLVSIIGILLTATGFCATFLLNAMWSGQKAHGERLTQILERLSASDARQAASDEKLEILMSRVERIEDEVSEKCNREDCPQRRKAHG